MPTGEICGLGAREPGNGGDPYEVPRATSEITIDGVIDEAAWDDALRLELNYEVRPGENIKPQVETRVFITYDTTHLLVAFRAFDPAPEKIRARFRDRDNMHGDDSVGITIDTFNDQRRDYEFMVNPLGVQMDGIYSEGNNDNGRGFDRAWDAIWTSEGGITEEGYEVEIAVPFNQIRFQANGGLQVWGLDCTRSYPRNNRYHIGRHFAWEISHLYSTLEVEGGTLYEANVPQSTLVWQFNNRTYVRAILQYTDIQRNQDLYEDEVDELSRDFFVQLLFSYKVNPRTVFYTGYSEGGAENQDITMTSTSRSFFLKISYAWLW